MSRTLQFALTATDFAFSWGGLTAVGSALRLVYIWRLLILPDVFCAMSEGQVRS
ncbi:MAG: hypothetical protein WCO83_06215 [Alphaproteobacteria bacterium]